MGGTSSVFREEELQDYEDLTYLTRKEILLAWQRWEELVGDGCGDDKEKRYPEEAIQQLPELKYNPFRARITRVFSSGRDNRLSFEDFLDLLSVMSDRAPLHLKAHYAFHIYDFNEDAVLDAEDLGLVVDSLTGQESEGLMPEERSRLVDRLLEETDLDGGGISEEEFKHFLTKCPDFTHAFRFSI